LHNRYPCRFTKRDVSLPFAGAINQAGENGILTEPEPDNPEKSGSIFVKLRHQ